MQLECLHRDSVGRRARLGAVAKISAPRRNMIDPTPAHGKTLRVSVIELPREESERRPCVPRAKSVAIEPNATCSLVLLDHGFRIQLERERVPKVPVGVSNPGLGEVERTNDPFALLSEAYVVVGEVVVK